MADAVERGLPLPGAASLDAAPPGVGNGVGALPCLPPGH